MKDMQKAAMIKAARYRPPKHLITSTLSLKNIGLQKIFPATVNRALKADLKKLVRPNL